MKLSMLQAATQTGVSKSTIYRAVKSGKLSASRDESGEYQLDPAELYRVFEPAPEPQHAEAANESAAANEAMVKWMQELVTQRDAQIADMVARHDAERDYWRSQLDRAQLPAPGGIDALRDQVDELQQAMKKGFFRRLFS